MINDFEPIRYFSKFLIKYILEYKYILSIYE